MKKLFTILFLFALTPFVWSQQVHVVETVGNTGFSPTNVVVGIGDTVRWVNTAGGHNVNGMQAAYPGNPESFGNSIGVGWTFDHVFTMPGFYNYHCDPHLGLGMIGTVSVLNSPSYPIGLVTGDSDMDGIADSVGVAATLTGVVHGVDLDGNDGVLFTIIDALGDGIGVFSSTDVSGYVVTEGDEISIGGTIGSFASLAQINPDTIILNSTGNTLSTVADVTALDESTESQLVRLSNVTLVDPSQWDNSGFNNIDITDGTNTFTLSLDPDVDLHAAPAPTGAFNITGIGGQRDFDAPFDGGYQLLPRYIADLDEIVDPCGIGTLTADSDADGLADSIGVTCTITGIVYGIDMRGGEGLSFTVIDAAGDGIGVFTFDDIDAYVVTEGDEVTITGEIGSFASLAQIDPTSITVNSQGNSLVNPTDVTALDESTESQLVRLTNMTLVDPTQWDNAGFNNIDITDGTNTFTLSLNPLVDLHAAPAPTGAFNITGIGGQRDFDAPFDGGYQLLPRYIADMEEIVPVVSGLIISGVADPQGASSTGGTQFGPRAIELYALEDIADLSIYGIGSANNGDGTDGIEFTFPAMAVTAGDCITLTDTASLARFVTFYGVQPSFLVPGGSANATGINGDDAVELFKDGEVVDVFGDINVDGNGEPWEYTDGWAYRKNATGPDGSNFVLNNWTYSGVDALQSDMDSVNTLFANPFPLCAYSPVPPVIISAVDDDVNLPIDVASNIDVLANDDTPNGVTSIAIITNPTNGIVMVNAAVDILYTPTMGFCGTDAIVYEICDGTDCSQATVNITIDCPLPAYPIGLVTADSDGDLLPDSMDVVCQLTGVVHGIDFDGNAGYSFTIIDAAGDGINVHSFVDVDGYVATEGDEVTVEGFILNFMGLDEIRAEKIIMISSGNSLVAPIDVAALGEDTESQFITMTSWTMVDPAQWLGDGSSYNVQITDGTNIYVMRIDGDTELAAMTAPAGDIFNITGIGGQFDDSGNPVLDMGYQIFPRYTSDIEGFVSTINPALAKKITLQPNPVSDVLQIRSEIQLDQIRVTNMLGQQITQLRQPNLNETINVNNWQSGVYVITFVTGDDIWTSQFVKQ